MKRFLFYSMGVLAASACLVVFVGCEDSSSEDGGSASNGAAAETGGPGAATADFSGTWDVRSGGWTRIVEIDQEGTTISGIIRDGGETHPLSGYVDGETAHLSGEDTTGTATLDGGSLSGQYSCATSSGSWTGTRL